jgi:hypothetical protein
MGFSREIMVCWSSGLPLRRGSKAQGIMDVERGVATRGRKRRMPFFLFYEFYFSARDSLFDSLTHPGYLTVHHFSNQSASHSSLHFYRMLLTHQSINTAFSHMVAKQDAYDRWIAQLAVLFTVNF